MWKYKRVIAIAIAILFLAVLFVLKNLPAEKNPLNNTVGLNYTGDETLEELIAKDTDLDGIPDWEETLLGMDPNNADSDKDGILDAKEIAQLNRNEESTTSEEENLTETERFSREFFSSAAALSQSGQVTPEIIDAITNSLANEIGKPGKYKTHLISNIKTVATTKITLETYNNKMKALYSNYPSQEIIISILKDSMSLEEEEIDAQKLSKLEPIINGLDVITQEMTKVSVPSEVSILHLNLLNNLEKQKEDLKNMMLVDSDPIMAIKATGQYADSSTEVQLGVNNLVSTLQAKLKNLAN